MKGRSLVGDRFSDARLVPRCAVVQWRGRRWSGRRRSAQRSRRCCSHRCAPRRKEGFLATVELRLLAAEAALRSCDPHALTGTEPDQIGLELRDHRQHVEQQPSHRVHWVVHRPTDAQADLPGGELVGDGSGVGQRPSAPVVSSRRGCRRRGTRRAPRGGRDVPGWCRSVRGRRRSARTEPRGGVRPSR